MTADIHCQCSQQQHLQKKAVLNCTLNSRQVLVAMLVLINSAFAQVLHKNEPFICVYASKWLS